MPLSDRQLAEVLKSCKSGYVDYIEFLSGKLFIKLPNYDNFARRKKVGFFLCKEKGGFMFQYIF